MVSYYLITKFLIPFPFNVYRCVLCTRNPKLDAIYVRTGFTLYADKNDFFVQNRPFIIEYRTRNENFCVIY
jgi:hypothetical protein